MYRFYEVTQNSFLKGNFIEMHYIACKMEKQMDFIIIFVF